MEAATLTEYVQKALNAPKDHPVLAFPSKPEAFSSFHRYTVSELKKLADRAATQYVSEGLKPRREGDRAQVVGIFAHGDIDWVATFFAVVRMGHPLLVLSSRLPDQTISALVDKSDCEWLIHDRKPEMYTQKPVKTLKIASSREPASIPSMDLNDLVCDLFAVNLDDYGWIMHSSGSTGIPKLLFSSQRHAMTELRLLRGPFFPSKTGWVASAVYNVLGLRMMALSLVKDNALTYLDNDRRPFTPQALEEFLQEARPELIWVTPYALELLSATNGGMEVLKQCDGVKTFGAVIPQTVGDKLVEHGIYIGSEYGMSEGGPLMTSSLRPREDQDWAYLMAISPEQAEYLCFKPMDLASAGEAGGKAEQLYELIVQSGSPWVLESAKDAEGNLSTGDLFLKHPTKEGRWTLVGRKDDQVKIYQGDRQAVINGFEYENKIKAGNEDVLEEAIVFGQGKNRLGVLIFAKCAVGSARDVVLERVWATVEREINSPLKVKIDKDMIIIVSGENHLPRTTKLNFIRPQVYMNYKELIEAAYPPADDQVVDGSINGNTGHI